MVLKERRPSTIHVGAHPRSLSFSGCGFLGVYHIGVASCIKQHAPGFLKNLKCIYGCSAGSIVAAMLLNDVCCGEVCKSTLEIVNDMRSRYLGPLSPSFKINKILLDGFRDALPPDAHLRTSGKLFISLTRLSDMKNVIVSQYSSRDELIDALLCSCFVPFYSGIIPPKYRGVYYVDGGLSNNLPEDPETITVSPWSGGSDICPKDSSISLVNINIVNTSAQMTINNLYRLSTMFFPPGGEVLSDFCKQGFREALQYLQEHGLFETANPTARSMSFSGELDHVYERRQLCQRLSATQKWAAFQSSAKFQLEEFEEVFESTLSLSDEALLKCDEEYLDMADSGVSESSSVTTECTSTLLGSIENEDDDQYDGNHTMDSTGLEHERFTQIGLVDNPISKLLGSSTVVHLKLFDEDASATHFSLPSAVLQALESSYLISSPSWYRPITKIASICGHPLILAQIPLHKIYGIALFLLKQASYVPENLKWLMSHVHGIVCSLQKYFQMKGADLVSKLRDTKDVLSDELRLLFCHLAVLVHILIQKVLIKHPGIGVSWVIKLSNNSQTVTKFCNFLTF